MATTLVWGLYEPIHIYIYIYILQRDADVGRNVTKYIYMKLPWWDPRPDITKDDADGNHLYLQAPNTHRIYTQHTTHSTHAQTHTHTQTHTAHCPSPHSHSSTLHFTVFSNRQHQSLELSVPLLWGRSCRSSGQRITIANICVGVHATLWQSSGGEGGGEGSIGW